MDLASGPSDPEPSVFVQWDQAGLGKWHLAIGARRQLGMLVAAAGVSLRPLGREEKKMLSPH